MVTVHRHSILQSATQANQGQIKVGALGPFLKYARVRTDKNFLEA